MTGNIRKKYSILGATQPIDFVTVRNGDVTILDEIVAIYYALGNICLSCTLRINIIYFNFLQINFMYVDLKILL